MMTRGRVGGGGGSKMNETNPIKVWIYSAGNTISN